MRTSGAILAVISLAFLIPAAAMYGRGTVTSGVVSTMKNAVNTNDIFRRAGVEIPVPLDFDGTNSGLPMSRMSKLTRTEIVILPSVPILGLVELGY